ncbi:MAG: hypothetical protein SWO11_01050 [Thermodesulfobacteriota bacterium]|nr:hypothetical protein [Thermodesulfobacteriota bacterium]
MRKIDQDRGRLAEPGTKGRKQIRYSAYHGWSAGVRSKYVITIM